MATEVDVNLDKYSVSVNADHDKNLAKKLRAPGFEPGRSESWSTACVLNLERSSLSKSCPEGHFSKDLEGR